MMIWMLDPKGRLSSFVELSMVRTTGLQTDFMRKHEHGVSLHRTYTNMDLQHPETFNLWFLLWGVDHPVNPTTRRQR